MRMYVPASLLIVACGAAAHAHEADIGLRVENGVITTWEAEHSPLNFIKPERVFTGDLDLHLGVVEGDEPGFIVEGVSPLAGHRLGFNIRAAARVWDIVGQNFLAISPDSITIERSLIGSITTPAADPTSPIPGLSFVVPAGGADFHYDFILNGTTAGLYLLELEKWTEAPGVGNSEPFWIILNYDMPGAQQTAAVNWVNQYLVPAPGSLAMLALGALAATRRRRKQ